jgi:hypothetical protein
MTQSTKPEPGPFLANGSPDLHHGDLRKAAYLKRRAEYQMQASNPVTAQAGTLKPDTSTTKQAGRLR